LITDRKKHEGLTLEAARAATILPPARTNVVLLVKDVPHVTVRGFRLTTEPQKVFLVGVMGRSPGVVLERLDCRSTASLGPCGIDVESVAVPEGDPPVVVRNCTLATLEHGIRVAGIDNGKPAPCRGVVLRQNNVSGCDVGIGVIGQVRDIHIVGNRVWDCGKSAVYLTELLEGTAGLLLANNSLQNRGECLEIEGPAAGLRGVEVRNNLLLPQSGPDIVFSGKDQAVLKGWRFGHNWRQVRPTGLSEADAARWVRADGDTVTDSVELVSVDAKKAGFLRPGPGSALATGGAGNADPSLPRYVGALPPEGAEPWDWDRTWRARAKQTAEKTK
jgi:hypothetical protein